MRSRGLTMGSAVASAWLLLSFSLSACAIEEAHGKPRLAATDAGARRGDGRTKSPRPDAAATISPRPGSQASLVGLTRTQVEARRGLPTEKRGNTWVYTPEQSGCREEIVSEVVTFRGNVVTAVNLQLTRTNKICRGLDWGER